MLFLWYSLEKINSRLRQHRGIGEGAELELSIFDKLIVSEPIDFFYYSMLTKSSIVTIMYLTQPPRLVPFGVSRNLGGFSLLVEK